MAADATSAIRAASQRTDGKIVTVYYFHDEPLGDRYIAATIWEP